MRDHIPFDQQILTVTVKMSRPDADHIITERHMFILGQVNYSEASLEKVRNAYTNAMHHMVEYCNDHKATLIGMSTSIEYAAELD